MAAAQAPIPLQFAAPDHYQLSGSGINITYTPIGSGGLAHLYYQDAQRTHTFNGDQIRKLDVPDIGTVVSVTLVMTVDSGSTTFSVLIPKVNLLNHAGASTSICTEGITTVHRFSIVPAFNMGQEEIYSVTPMTGTASLILIPQ